MTGTETNLIIIPTYDEKENIEDIINSVFKKYDCFQILVVDDNSPDGTSAIVQSLIKKYPTRLFLEQRVKKDGLGKAYIHGFRWALNKNYNAIFQMDADFSHPPKYLKKMAEILSNNESDVVIGSRYVNGVNVVNWPLRRILLSYFASLYVRYILQIPVKDPTAGFVGYKKEVLNAISINKVKSIGYGFQIEMKYRAYKNKFRIKETSIIFPNREKGESKMSGNIIWEAIFVVIILKIKSIFKIL